MLFSISSRRSSGFFSSAVIGCLALFTAAGAAGAASTNVVTYHMDHYRTGWNSVETQLTQASVAGGTFGLQQTVALDGQVDVQPLIATGMTIAGAKHDVVYVATENDTVYAIDAESVRSCCRAAWGSPCP